MSRYRVSAGSSDVVGAEAVDSLPGLMRGANMTRHCCIGDHGVHVIGGVANETGEAEEAQRSV